MIQRTCDCCGEAIKNDEPFFGIKFVKFYDDLTCARAIFHQNSNALGQSKHKPDFCNKCTALIYDHIQQLHKKYMGNNAKEFNLYE